MNAPLPSESRYTVLDAPPRRLRDFLLRWEVILVILLAGGAGERLAVIAGCGPA